jgi:hypothetical protein
MYRNRTWVLSEYRIKRHPLQASQARLLGSELVPELSFSHTLQASFTSLHDSDRKIHYKSSRFRALTTKRFDCDLIKAIDSLAQRFLEFVLKFEYGNWRAGLGGWGCEVKLLPLRYLEVEQAVRNEVIRHLYL